MAPEATNQNFWGFTGLAHNNGVHDFWGYIIWENTNSTPLFDKKQDKTFSSTPHMDIWDRGRVGFEKHSNVNGLSFALLIVGELNQI